MAGMGKESLTVKDLKNDRDHLEKNIRRLIREFEEKWVGARVDRIDLLHTVEMATGVENTAGVDCAVKL